MDFAGGFYLNGEYTHAHTGSIPTEIGAFTALQSFSIEENHITGLIPSELGLLTNLIVLNLGENDITGSMPTELGNLRNLQELVIQCNDLTGSVPAEMADLVSLNSLDASCNVNMCGCLPGDLADATSENSYDAYMGTNFGHDCGDAQRARPKQCRTIKPMGRKCAARWNEGDGGGDGDGDDWMYIHPNTLLPWVSDVSTALPPSLDVLSPHTVPFVVYMYREGGSRMDSWTHAVAVRLNHSRCVIDR